MGSGASTPTRDRVPAEEEAALASLHRYSQQVVQQSSASPSPRTTELMPNKHAKSLHNVERQQQLSSPVRSPVPNLPPVETVEKASSAAYCLRQPLRGCVHLDREGPLKAPGILISAKAIEEGFYRAMTKMPSE